MTKAEFYQQYIETAKQFGVPPTIVEGLEIDRAEFTEYRKIRRNRAVTFRLSADDLNRLNAICTATGASKTEVIVKLLHSAARFLPELPTTEKSKADFKRRVIVKTRWKQ